MGTSLTDTHKLIKPDDLEGVDVDQLNQNWDMIDKIIPVIIGGAVPEGSSPKIYGGMLTTSTGAGGVNRTGAGATNTAGIGGIWPGYQGIPKFEGISSVVLTQNNGGDTIFDVGLTVVAYSPTVIRYRAKRYDGSLGYSFGTLGIHMTIIGW